MTPEEYCQTKTATSGSSFYYSFLFLPPLKKQAIMAVYAFCREVDDVVDECQDSAVARIKLAWWRDDIERVFHATPQHPVSKALAAVLPHFHLEKSHFLEIIAGMGMDLEQHEYATFKELEVYCYKAAGVVGLLAAEIFGYQDSNTLKYAQKLGIAFQLTNIIRDVREDLGRGRIYLPQEDLARFQVHPQELGLGKTTPNIKNLLAFQTQRARDYYQEAFAALAPVDRYTQRSGIIMAEIYLDLLKEIEGDGYHVLTQRTRLTPLRKLWIAWKTARREKKFRHPVVTQ